MTAAAAGGVRDELAGRSVGEFVLRERIGEGGFGAVYRCEQPLLGRQAVVKVLHQRLRASEVMIQRFLREARIASRLDHPYAAHIYAFGVEPDGLLWIAMEMVHGTRSTAGSAIAAPCRSPTSWRSSSASPRSSRYLIAPGRP